MAGLVFGFVCMTGWSTYKERFEKERRSKLYQDAVVLKTRYDERPMDDVNATQLSTYALTRNGYEASISQDMLDEENTHQDRSFEKSLSKSQPPPRNS